MKLKKLGQGEVVAVILLVLLSIAAVVTIISFVLPFIKRNLDKSCFDYRGKIEIKNDDKYTCYDNNAKNLRLKIRFGDLEDETTTIKGLIFIIYTKSVSEIFKIIPPDISSGVSPFSGNVITLPNSNGERTYNFTLNNGNVKPDSVAVYPILSNNKECSEAKYDLDSIPYC
ncbi:MAG: hypothetical protein QXW97_03455 [Candidatus Pacearchaeota archaeon]